MARSARTALAVALVTTATALVAAAGFVPVAAHARPYRPSGPSITGGSEPGAAVALNPGVHVDSLASGVTTPGGNGSSRYYVITVERGETPYVAATLVSPEDAAEDTTFGVQVSLLERGETTACDDDSATDFQSGDGLHAVTAVVAPGPAGTKDGCPAGQLIVQVERTGNAAPNDPLEVEVAYRLEPVATSSGGPAPATSASNQRADLVGPPATIRSGTDFAGSPILASGVYRDTIDAGDIRIVRVHLGWGQRFAFDFSAAARSGGEDDDVQITATIRNPLRQEVDKASGGTSSTFGLGRDQAALSGSTLAPVRYRNRGSEDDTIARYANAGDYYLVLTTTEPDAGRTSGPVPYTLQIRVFGTAGSGPSYRPLESAQAGDSAPAADTRTPIVIVLIVAGVLIIGLVAWLFRRLRRPRQSRTHT